MACDGEGGAISHKAILVHNCFNACEPIAGIKVSELLQRFTFHQLLNLTCSCRWHISFRDRDAMLMEGLAYIALRASQLGSPIPEWREIVVAFRDARARSARTISSRDIVRAYAEDNGQFERMRIEHYGMLTEEAVASIGAVWHEGEVMTRKIQLVPRQGISNPVRVMPPQPDE